MSDPANSRPAGGINVSQIVQSVLTYLITSVFVGACVIVWRGATSVDDRVHATQQSLQVLIDNLSAKLAAYETQLDTQSNLLASICSELQSNRQMTASWQARRATNRVEGRQFFDARDTQQLLRQDISKQLQQSKE